ncbi:MAG TPA: hypothetical protein H9809_00475 [Candidatus Blautia pullicola]|jgi:hypothetical protein|uniref:Uncharacterized protein n=1 Tax=Candidatus Blautia pullicola TaxID=2838498 RepID=A0A9D2JRT6_9FIRM|nr:hypothetical protein [Candidatus Blautia pullicola]
MEHLIFCFGACFMGVISLISMLAVYRSNKRVLKDLRHPSQGKDRWLAGFVQEYEKQQKENTRIQNPSVYVVKRMRGRKIGAFSMRQVKGISWGAFILSFLFAGIQILSVWQTGTGAQELSLLGRQVSLLSFSVVGGISGEIFLLALRMIMGLGYQEDVIETNLLDYVENRWKEPGKIIPLENARNSGKRDGRGGKKKEEPGPKEGRERAARQMEQSIMEAAATDSRYSHLLNKEEEAIVKDVIKEFLT